MEGKMPAADLEREETKNGTNLANAARPALAINNDSSDAATIPALTDCNAAGVVPYVANKEQLPAANNDSKSHLLNTPAEIRNEIYLHVLNITDPICLNPILHYGPLHVAACRFKIPSLLHINRQIRHEAAGLFYSRTTFLCHFSATTISQCLSIVDQSHLKFLKNVECRSYDGTRSARLFLRVVREMLGSRAEQIGKGVVRAAVKGLTGGEERWICLSEVEGWEKEREKVVDKAT